MAGIKERLKKLVVQHKAKGIFLDTNVLLLFIFAVYQPSKIGLKRLDKYVKEDGDLIKNYVNNFSRIITTPHILAETSNLARQISKDKHWVELATKLYPLFCTAQQDALIQLNINEYTVDAELFEKLGLTDAYIASTTVNEQLLLTDDLDLYLAALSRESDAINFTHMREAAGTV